METLCIHYRFLLPEQREEDFTLQLDAFTLEPVNPPPSDLPQWTRLGFRQCPHCPLPPGSTPHCPVAASIADIVNRFDGLKSYDAIEVAVDTDERRVIQRTTLQKGLSSLMGLFFATSGCPRTAFFKPMARFHLPLASTEETIYRASSMYLLAQFFRSKDGLTAGLRFDGLVAIYQHLQTLNMAIAERIRAASLTDSSVNAVILLDMLAKSLPFAVYERLEELRHLYTAYLDGDLPAPEPMF